MPRLFAARHVLSQLARLAVLALLCVLPRVALAQTCSFTISNIAFGNVSTISGAPTDANGVIGVNCSGFSTTKVHLCLSIGDPKGGSLTARTLTGPSGTLAFGLFTDAAHTVPWGSVFSSAVPAAIVDLSVSNGNATGTAIVYGRVSAGQAGVPTGVYSSNFSANDTLFGYVGYSGTAPTCTNSLQNSRPAFVITATVAADCNIVAAPLAFPPVSARTTKVSANTTVSVTCVSGAPFSVSLNAGITPGATLINRLMQLAGGKATVAYGLFTDAALTQPWGDGTSGTTMNSGTGTGGSQTFTVYGQVFSQPVPPPGNYSDTITATISF